MSGAEEPDRVDAFLKRAGADQVRHGRGRSLYEHLVGTRRILQQWSQPSHVCDAGSLHSIYGTDVFQHRLVSTERRHEVRELVGSEAERLIYVFSVIQRAELFQMLGSRDRIPPDGLRVQDEPLSREEIRSLLVMYMANQAEQASAPDGGPGRWLQMLSWMGRLLGREDGIVPPVLDGCRQVISPEQELGALEAYAAGLSAMATDRTTALRELSRAAELCPWVAEPAVWLAYLALQQGALEDAGAWADRAGKLLLQWATPWDKRLTLQQWSWLISFLAEQVSAGGVEPAPLPAPDPRRLPDFVERVQQRTWVRVFLGPDEPEEACGPGTEERFHRYVASFASPDHDSPPGVYPGLRAQPWHDPRDVPLALALEAAYPEIRREVLGLDTRRFPAESERIPRTGDWKVLFLNERGRANEEVCAQCPTLSKLIHQERRVVRTLSGLSYISRLCPGTHVAPHHGPTNLRLRCHLPIAVPAGNCGIRVDGQTRTWEEGRCLVFDDFMLHEAWNHSSGDRVVVIVDLWHPDLSDREVELLEGLHRYVAAQTASLNGYWSRNDRARAARECPKHG